jgi:hypothetical protein
MDKSTKTKVIKALKAAKRLLETKKWTKNDYARKANGQTPCNILSKEATCFCAEGALRRVSNVDEWDQVSCSNTVFTAADRLLNTAVLQEINSSNEQMYHVNSYNDDKDTTKKDILRIFDKAVDLAKKE